MNYNKNIISSNTEEKNEKFNNEIELFTKVSKREKMGRQDRL